MYLEFFFWGGGRGEGRGEGRAGSFLRPSCYFINLQLLAETWRFAVREKICDTCVSFCHYYTPVELYLGFLLVNLFKNQSSSSTYDNQLFVLSVLSEENNMSAVFCFQQGCVY